MSLKHFFAAALLLVALAASTAAALQCPAVQTQLYNYPATPCPRVDKCLASACACLGGTFDNVTRVCPALSTVSDCSTFTTCARQAIKCFNEEAELATAAAECTEWARPIYTALLEATATDAFVNTTLYAACTYEVCLWANQTARCTPDYAAACVAPPRFYGTLRLSGDWADIIAVPSQKRDIMTIIEAELAGALNTTVDVTSVRAGSLIVDFALLEFSDDTERALLALANNTAWLQNIQAAYTAYGGVGTLSVEYIGPVLTAAPGGTPAPTNSTGGDDDSGSKCGGGCIGGIIAGCVVFVVIIAAVLYLRGRKSDSGEDSELTMHEGGARYSTTA